MNCQQCGKPLILLPSGWLSCPDGHGKLIAERLTDKQQKAVAKHDAAWRRKLNDAFPKEKNQ